MRSIARLLILLLATSAAAQNTDIEALSGLQFNFGNPGARALGMGGAFIGLADDASAAEANPAGLTILRVPEVSLEMRQATIAQRFVTGGTFPFITTRDFPSRETSVNFASVVLPTKSAALALYYHRPLSFTSRVDLTGRYGTPNFFLGPDGPVSEENCGADCTEHRIYPFSTSVDIEMETFGLAAARQWRTLSFGAGVRYHRFSEEADTFRRDLDAPGQPVFVVAQTNAGRTIGRRSDRDVTFVGGLRWTPLPSFSAGAVFKKGPTFPVSIAAAHNVDVPMQVVDTTEFHVPTTFGAGISLRPVQQVTINVDAVHVGYGKLTDRFISVIEYGTEEGGPIEQVTGYRTKDGLEIHAGIEYFTLSKYPVGMRAGWWRDPAHAISYRGTMRTSHEVAAKILFPETEAENHYSVGIGIALPRVGIDVAYDTSRSIRSASVSVIARR
ncbi:MAG: OmpP1/FadL family transporter [Thermoanaerobaculia bacterium]